MKLHESHGQALPNAPPQFRLLRESILAVKTPVRINADLSQEKSRSSPPQKWPMGGSEITSEQHL